jgi:hypothetical protein
MPAPIQEEQLEVLRTLQNLLRMFGDANDAEDHNFSEFAEQERRDAGASIRELMDQHDFLLKLLPTLQNELQSRHILTFGWAQLYDNIDEYLQAP